MIAWYSALMLGLGLGALILRPKFLGLITKASAPIK